MIDRIKILDTKVLTHEKYNLKKIRYEYYKEDGSRHEKARKVFDRGDAATILLYNKENKTVILTRQFRLPAYINGCKTGMLTEACAGMLEEGPELGIKRETLEETGYEINEVQKIFQAYMSPGAVTELMHFFIAPYDASMKVTAGGGAEGEEENIDVLEITMEEAMQMITKGEIQDGKTIMLLLYVSLHGIM